MKTMDFLFIPASLNGRTYMYASVPCKVRSQTSVKESVDTYYAVVGVLSDKYAPIVGNCR